MHKYRAGYELKGHGFVPLVADAYGNIGACALRFFHRVAAVFSASADHPIDSFASSRHYIYHRLRLRFLVASLHATATRVLGGWLCSAPSSSSPSDGVSSGAVNQHSVNLRSSVPCPGASVRGPSSPSIVGGPATAFSSTSPASIGVFHSPSPVVLSLSQLTSLTLAVRLFSLLHSRPSLFIVRPWGFLLFF